MQAVIVLGTRPEIIKLSPVVQALAGRGVSLKIVHTGQHHDREMDSALFDELVLPEPVVNLGVHTSGEGERMGLMLQGLGDALGRLRPDIVVVQGDTDSALAGALAAVKMHIPVAHVEAGLRSFDRSMPEEVNRVLIDHMSQLLFAPTETSAGNLGNEGLYRGVRVVGNTVVDALEQQLELALEHESQWLRCLPGKFVLATVHRDSNVDHYKRFAGLLAGLEEIARQAGMPVVFPMHPRTRVRADSFGLLAGMECNPRFVLSPPLGRLDFVATLRRAAVVVTDSGGVQEEACILEVAAVTVRSTTERPETVAVGANVLAPVPDDMVRFALDAIRHGRGRWPNPLGAGRSGGAIADFLVDFHAVRPPEGDGVVRMH